MSLNFAANIYPGENCAGPELRERKTASRG